MTANEPRRHVVLVCGGRTYADRDRLFAVLDALDPRPTLVVNGAATGADRLSTLWAWSRGVRKIEYPAQWERDGYAAGPIRNQVMLTREKPHLVVAFPGGKGTADMVRRARKAGVPVQEVSQ